MGEGGRISIFQLTMGRGVPTLDGGEGVADGCIYTGVDCLI